jgi:hypothetical protein
MIERRGSPFPSPQGGNDDQPDLSIWNQLGIFPGLFLRWVLFRNVGRAETILFLYTTFVGIERATNAKLDEENRITTLIGGI